MQAKIRNDYKGHINDVTSYNFRTSVSSSFKSSKSLWAPVGEHLQDKIFQHTYAFNLNNSVGQDFWMEIEIRNIVIQIKELINFSQK